MPRTEHLGERLSLRRRQILLRKGPQRAENRHSSHRGLEALATDVADHHKNGAAGLAKNPGEVAADFLRRQIPGLDAKAGDRRRE
jgi:hypothetical protein